MDTEDVVSLVEDLTTNIDDLEESLAPLLNASLSASTSKLPLLDKAKLYVLATYSLESILFSSLRLHGVNAREHAIYRELARVKEYSGKIQTAEIVGTKRNTTLDKDAAGRFVKAGLAGNDRYDRERAVRQEREKAGAKRKLQNLEQSARYGSQNRFEATAKRIRAAEAEEQVPVVRVEDSSDDSEADENGEAPLSERSKEDKKVAKRQRRIESKLAKQSPAGSPDHTVTTDTGLETTASSGAEGAAVNGSKLKIGPRSNHDTFQALMQGPLPKTEETKHKKKKRKSRGQMQRELEDKRADEMK